MALVDVTKLASALNLSPRRVQQLAKEEGMPRASKGLYDPIQCMMWYVRFLQAALEKRSVPSLDGGFVGEREERIRLLSADADLKEMKLAKERSQLVAIQDVELAFAELILNTKARILAVAPRVAPQVLGLTSRVMAHAILEKELKAALLQLSKREDRIRVTDTNSPADASGNDAPSGESLKAGVQPQKQKEKADKTAHREPHRT